MWSAGAAETEYAALMWRLSRAVRDNADKADAVVAWKRGDEIQAMVQSETKRLIKQYVGPLLLPPIAAAVATATVFSTAPPQHPARFKKRAPIVNHNPIPDFNLLDMFPIEPEVEAPKKRNPVKPSQLYQVSIATRLCLPEDRVG